MEGRCNVMIHIANAADNEGGATLCLLKKCQKQIPSQETTIFLSFIYRLDGPQFKKKRDCVFCLFKHSQMCRRISWFQHVLYNVHASKESREQCQLTDSEKGPSFVSRFHIEKKSGGKDRHWFSHLLMHWAAVAIWVERSSTRIQFPFLFQIRQHFTVNLSVTKSRNFANKMNHTGKKQRRERER